MADCWYNSMLVDEVQTLQERPSLQHVHPFLAQAVQVKHERPHLKKRRGSRTKGAKGMVTAA
jgi:GTP1/Obg family GTP-binding protein